MRFLLVVILYILCASSCKEVPVNEKMVDLPRQEWGKNLDAVTEFDIKGSIPHKLFFVIRHTERFPFTNILTSLSILDTAKHHLYTLHLNIPLTSHSGNWNGMVMDDIWYHCVKIEPPVSLKPGTYRFVLQQQMKEEVLPHILSVGIAIDK